MERDVAIGYGTGCCHRVWNGKVAIGGMATGALNKLHMPVKKYAPIWCQYGPIWAHMDTIWASMSQYGPI